MAWDETKPANSDLVRDFPTLDQADKTVLQDTISAEHKPLGDADQGVHTFPVVASDPATTIEGRLAIVENALKWYSNGAWRTTADPFPVGSVIAWPGNNASIPTNWVRCAGQEISRTTFAELFALIGTTYGI